MTDDSRSIRIDLEWQSFVGIAHYRMNGGYPDIPYLQILEMGTTTQEGEIITVNIDTTDEQVRLGEELLAKMAMNALEENELADALDSLMCQLPSIETFGEQ